MSLGYYKLKTGAYKLIDKLHSEKKTTPEIVLAVSTTFGFGQNFVENRLDNLKKVREGKKK